MIKSHYIKEKLQTTQTVESITHILESLASIRIGQIKDDVLTSREYFQRLWSIFSQLRINEKEGQRQQIQKKSRSAALLITANAGLSGEIDTNLISLALSEIDINKTDFIVYGLHGEQLLLQRGIKPAKVFKFPEVGAPIDTSECANFICQYEKPLVYFPSYRALTVQYISKIELIDAVQTVGAGDEIDLSQIISKDNTIFEPTLSEVVQYLEQIMVGVILTEIILESNLAQFSSRFNAMTSASARASHSARLLQRQYRQIKRYELDEANRQYRKVKRVLT